ncbi:hypothetical protein K2173_005512 [Erythroxylum novogranatense]|uniref:RRM domain-containing protein n=1 Tax=Erythroxylum novogranatense TaxID=1862640 RepID=A0AAV8SK93_9ROSI|nr:hypothetical protein K2173_005512 [Erythroxylum novogranatense]
MSFEIMDHRGGTASSHFFDDVVFPAERKVGFWKHHSLPGHQDGMIPTPGSKLVASSSLDRFSSTGSKSVDCSALSQSVLAEDQKEKLLMGEMNATVYKTTINSVDHHPKSWSSLSAQPASYNLGRSLIDNNGAQWESSLFSSSLSDVFSRKLALTNCAVALGTDSQSHQPAKIVQSHQKEVEPFESLEEIEARTIGDLLPAEDSLFSGVTDELGQNGCAYNGDDLEDFDLFSSVGGMELEGDESSIERQRKSVLVGLVANGKGSLNGSTVGKNPSKSIFVGNINNKVEDSDLKALAEGYGEIRAARGAWGALPPRSTKADLHNSFQKENPAGKDMNQVTLVVYNVDPSVSDNEIHCIFGAYGEIKQIHEGQHIHQRVVEYYDARAAEAALSALDRTDIAGKQIKLELSHPFGTRCFIQQPELEHEEPNLCQSPFDDLSSRQMVFSPGVIASSSMENVSAQVLHSTVQSPVTAFMEAHQSSSVPNNLPFPASFSSVGKQFNLCETNRSLDEIKFGMQRMSNFHPHSLPECHDGLANVLPYGSSSAMAGMASSVGSKITEGINNRNIGGVGSNGHLFEINGGAFGSPGNGNCTLPGHQYMWSNGNSSQQHQSNHMIWPNSSSFINGVHGHQLPHMTGFRRAPPIMLNAAHAQHHVGSAPSVNPSLWDMRHAYSGESPEASSFHLGSLGSVGFPGSSPPHPMEIASRSIFSHIGGNAMDLTKSNGLHSQQIRHIFPGRNPMITNPVSFDSSNECVRNLSHRRIESNPNNSDKKQFELDVDRIIRGEDSRTTLMIKNIPNKYTSKMLLAAIDEHCRGTYDFLYLPIDFKNKCNVGYAFVNMIDPQQIIPFYKAFNGKKWEKFNSEKVASLAYARIQGKAALIAHFQNSSLMNEDKRCRPILFHTDGPNAGDPEPFPMGTNIRPRLGKPRTSSGEENHLSSLAGGEDPSNGTDSSSVGDCAV